jgi:hypothetical protein
MSTEDDGRDGGERKERVLHTRIPESLEQEIKNRANRLGVSVSNLVRNVLHNAFSMVDDIVADSATIAKTARDATAPLSHVGCAARSDRAAGAARVLGWQPLILEINAVCERCNALLPKGSDAAVAVLDGDGPRAIRCTSCVKELP